MTEQLRCPACGSERIALACTIQSLHPVKLVDGKICAVNSMAFVEDPTKPGNQGVLYLSAEGYDSPDTMSFTCRDCPHDWDLPDDAEIEWDPGAALPCPLPSAFVVYSALAVRKDVSDARVVYKPARESRR